MQFYTDADIGENKFDDNTEKYRKSIFFIAFIALYLVNNKENNVLHMK